MSTDTITSATVNTDTIAPAEVAKATVGTTTRLGSVADVSSEQVAGGAVEVASASVVTRGAARASAVAVAQPAVALQYHQGPGSWRCPARPAAAD